MSMSWFSVKTLLKTSLHLAFTGVLIIRNEIAKYALVNFPIFKSIHRKCLPLSGLWTSVKGEERFLKSTDARV